MTPIKRLELLGIGLLATTLALAGCKNGDDGAQGPPGPAGPGAGSFVDASVTPDAVLAELDVVSDVSDVQIASPPKVTFTLETSAGVPIIGIVPFWEDSNRYVRFTLAKLVPGTDGDPDSWVSYTRNDSNEPTYDSGSSLVDHGDGSYTFTFATDVTAVPGVPYEPSLTHRLAGQLGSSSVSLEAQNFAFDFVPDGSPVSRTRDIAMTASCNECHSNLVIHGRRFRVEYCVTCHNPDLADGEGNFSFMVHRIHSAGEFAELGHAASFAELTYPQSLANCRKCHDGTDADTPEGDNWKTLPNLAACFGCHEESAHPGGMPPADNMLCTVCHTSVAIEEVHATSNATPNNPNLLAGEVEIGYDLMDATVDAMTNEVTVRLRILADGSPLDVANLPADIAGPGRYPGLLLAWALPQEGMAEPLDYNNLGERAAQALSLALDDFLAGGPTGTHAYDAGTGVNTFVVTDVGSQFPVGATLRAVGLQGYFQQDIGGEIVSLHTPSAVVAVTGDAERRMVVDSAKCSSCHEWFEGHGGNRTYNIQICTMCHVPNLSSTGRTVTDPTLRDLDDALADAIAAGTLDGSVVPTDPLTYPEASQSLKSLVHGIHSSAFRTQPFQHVRGPSRQGYFDWSEVTFPAEVNQCSLCHDGDTYELPLGEEVLPTTVRTTGVMDGQDLSVADAEAAFVAVPNPTDWVNSPVSSACVDCHTDPAAKAHMETNGGRLSVHAGTFWTNRDTMTVNLEACAICHGPGKTADVAVVHDH